MKHPLKQALDAYDFKPQVHDHFDGSAHCVECQGFCQLTGADMAYTALVRALFDGEAWGEALNSPQEIPYIAIRQLRSAGVDTARFLARAKANTTLAKE
jgi:hypothetical protein